MSRVTGLSRAIGALVVVALCAALIILAHLVAEHPPKWLVLALFVVGLATYYFAIWPRLLRLKPWTPFKYWLPKSRLVGYAVYLLLPIALIALLLYLAARLGLGM